MKVTSKQELYFSDYEWGINKDEATELPANKEAQAAILAHPSISEVKEKAPAKTTSN